MRALLCSEIYWIFAVGSFSSFPPAATYTHIFKTSTSRTAQPPTHEDEPLAPTLKYSMSSLLARFSNAIPAIAASQPLALDDPSSPPLLIYAKSGDLKRVARLLSTPSQVDAIINERDKVCLNRCFTPRTVVNWLLLKVSCSL